MSKSDKGAFGLKTSQIKKATYALSYSGLNFYSNLYPHSTDRTEFSNKAENRAAIMRMALDNTWV